MSGGLAVNVDRKQTHPTNKTPEREKKKRERTVYETAVNSKSCDPVAFFVEN